MGVFRCLAKNLVLPENNPIFCHKHNPINSTFVMECCKDSDMCNIHLEPKLIQRPQGRKLPTLSLFYAWATCSLYLLFIIYSCVSHSFQSSGDGSSNVLIKVVNVTDCFGTVNFMPERRVLIFLTLQMDIYLCQLKLALLTLLSYLHIFRNTSFKYKISYCISKLFLLRNMLQLKNHNKNIKKS